jgi:mycothiol system anti-sigma-R factor
MMDCKEVNETLFLFVDNEMDDDRRIPFRDHVAKCSGCTKKMNYTLKLILIVRQRCVRCTAPAALRHRILTSFPHRQKPLGPTY